MDSVDYIRTSPATYSTYRDLSLRESGWMRTTIVLIVVGVGITYLVYLNAEYIIGKLLILIGKMTAITSKMGTLGAEEVVDDIGEAGETIGESVESVGEKLVDSESAPLVKPAEGYCYIGTSRGVRTCAEVDNSQRCMSGDIFPTMDICVNPSLRV